MKSSPNEKSTADQPERPVAAARQPRSSTRSSSRKKKTGASKASRSSSRNSSQSPSNTDKTGEMSAASSSNGRPGAVAVDGMRETEPQSIYTTPPPDEPRDASVEDLEAASSISITSRDQQSS
eukprot:CAMPEP_0176130610 /NCGR_PEP_ID=MMETSP0120_2-20121206/66090_1 /TAXON_ID=160619 /ORGANISM="Kryptoperidinium foliaceum, Strain CCMP 1326" /LENGTH=122 /DNA_ID=CAMNT_0017465913 /DNA_START=226 /DNA_END=590 /DNA_ORIENTATION=+